MENFKDNLKDLELPYIMDLDNDSDTLLITIAGISGGLGLYPFEFFKMTNGFNIDKIFIRDLNQSWYHKGLENKAQKLEDIAFMLRKIIKEKKYKNVVCLGNSMGAYASIIIGTLINVNKVIAFAPQTFLNNELREKYKDNRWIEQISNFPENIKKEYLDLRIFLNNYKKQNKTEINVYFALDERIDTIHALQLKDFKNINLISYIDGGHQLVQNLRKTGELYKILRNSLMPFDEDQIVSVFKDLKNGVTLQETLFLNNIKIEKFYDYYAKFNNLENFEGDVLFNFFQTIDNTNQCVNEKIINASIYNLEKCIKWFKNDKYKIQMFGTFIFINNSNFLLHIEVGTKNLHIGFVKYIKIEESYKIEKLSEEEFVYIKSKLEIDDLNYRNWGYNWCSIDLGEFIDLSLIDKYQVLSFKNNMIETIINKCKRLENE